MTLMTLRAATALAMMAACAAPVQGASPSRSRRLFWVLSAGVPVCNSVSAAAKMSYMVTGPMAQHTLNENVSILVRSGKCFPLPADQCFEVVQAAGLSPIMPFVFGLRARPDAPLVYVNEYQDMAHPITSLTPCRH